LGSEYISFYKNLGYDGVIITDHFFNGNCAVPKDLPWKERVEFFCRGYEIAKEEGDRQGFKVFFAWEDRYLGDEYLVYGLDKNWLLEHPDMLSWDHITHYNKIHESGGVVVQAHPFRERGYLSEMSVHPYQCDAFEVANSGNPFEQNRIAYRYAKEHNITMTAGSDMHLVGHTDNGFVYGMEFDKPLNSIMDFVDYIKKGTGYSLHVPYDQIEWQEGTSHHLPLFIYDKDNNPHPVSNPFN
jgi:hypothetical protein